MPSARRPIVLVANAGNAVGQSLRAAGFDVRPIRFTPFDQAAAAKVQHFDTYNRTAASQRVADIVSALRATPGAFLVAAGDEALAGALASAIEPPRMAILDVQQFDTSSDQAFLDHLDIPGIRMAGDLQTASELAGTRVVIHNAGSAFVASGGRVQPAALGPAEIAGLVRKAR